MKIYLITANPRLTKQQEKRLKAIGNLVIINANKLSPTDFVAKTKSAHVLIVGSSGIDELSKKILEQLPDLKFISLLTIGTDWVDLAGAKALGIPVSNIKGANAESVAEHAWSMILSLAKKTYEFNRDAREKGAYKFAQYQGKEVYGKTLGIIGTGDIGKKVARIGKGFNMRILGNNSSGKNVHGIEIVSLEKLLQESDIISISTPLTEKTQDLIGHKELAFMKQGNILVNCAREEIVNKEAVINAIKSGKLFGYGVETEIMKPISQNDQYFQYPNIIATPHNAFFTEDADKRTFDLAIDNIEKKLAGTSQNIVNP